MCLWHLVLFDCFFYIAQYIQPGPLRLGKLHDLTTDLAKRKVVIEGSIGIRTGASSQNDNQYISPLRNELA